MNKITAEILQELVNGLGARFPRRLIGKEKERFLDEIEGELQAHDYEIERIKVRRWGFTNRLLFTKCEKPEVVFLAHYDTPTIMPLGISSVFTLFGHTKQVLASVLLIGLTLILSTIHLWLMLIGLDHWATAYLVTMSFLFVIPIFFPNPNNAEDNNRFYTEQVFSALLAVKRPT